jgi:hypothetical protein
MPPTEAKFIADQLERLVSLPLDLKEDIEHWDNECASFQEELAARCPTFELEHHVWHFFTDSDIRKKDAGYKRRQNQAVVDYIRRLRSDQ